MAKITRKTQKIFAGSAANNGVFGSAQAGSKILSNDPDQIQSLGAWVQGWLGATISAQKLPPLEEMQGIQYVATRQIAYILQEGIAEWDAGTEYNQNSIVKKTGTYELYGSITNLNTNNALPNQVDNANWKYLGTLGTVASPVIWGGTVGGTANAITLTPSPAATSYATPQLIAFLPTSSNTGAVTVNVSSLGVKSITKNGTIALVSNDLVAGKLALLAYDGTNFQLLNPATFGVGASIAATATLNLTSSTGLVVDITGNTGITAMTIPEGQIRILRFTGTPIITNGASLVLPGSANIQVAAGDYAVAFGYASGVVRLLYFRADGTPIVNKMPLSFANLKVQVTSNTATAITADEVVVKDASGLSLLLTGVSVTNAITTSGANGLDGGSEAANTWYYVWVIYNPTTSTTASLISTSATSPTMPSGYTHKARVGVIRNDASSNLYRTLQYGRRVQYVIGTNPSTSLNMSTGVQGNPSTPTWVTVAVGSFVPPTATEIGLTLQSNSNAACVAPNNSYGGLASTTTIPPLANGAQGNAVIPSWFMLLESTNIYYASAGGPGLFCNGWIDNL